MTRTHQGADRRRHHRSGPRRRHPGSFAVAVGGLLIALATVSCSGRDAVADPVRPVRPAGDSAPGSAPPTDHTTPPGATTPATEPAPAPTELAADDAETRARVDALLLRYDDLVTRLAADPVAALDPMHPARGEWNILVPVDTALSADVLEQLVVGPAAEGTRLLPGSDGHSYRHRSLSVGPPVDGMIEFTWCGYSPGVRVDSSSGSVVDDAVAYVHGSGRLLLDTGGWVIDALDHLSIDVHAPGSGDPCPAEQAASSGGGAP